MPAFCQAQFQGRRYTSRLAGNDVRCCFRKRNKIEIDVAVEALRDFNRRYRSGAIDLARFARICRATRVMQPYLNASARAGSVSYVLRVSPTALRRT